MNRNLILNLRGPQSTYCNCNKLCSSLEIDHVLPAWYIRQNVDKKSLKSSLLDPHNLYRCCSSINRKKGASLLDVNSTGQEISGLMSRSYLYMNWKYDIYFDEEILFYLKTMSIINKPFPFEIERSQKIYEKTGKKNPFIQHYPKVTFQKQ